MLQPQNRLARARFFLQFAVSILSVAALTIWIRKDPKFFMGPSSEVTIGFDENLGLTETQIKTPSGRILIKKTCNPEHRACLRGPQKTFWEEATEPLMDQKVLKLLSPDFNRKELTSKRSFPILWKPTSQTASSLEWAIFEISPEFKFLDAEGFFHPNTQLEWLKSMQCPDTEDCNLWRTTFIDLEISDLTAQRKASAIRFSSLMKKESIGSDHDKSKAPQPNHQPNGQMKANSRNQK